MKNKHSAKHTLGPWSTDGILIWSSEVEEIGGRTVAEVNRNEFNGQDAYLIAAAPQLLEELNNAVAEIQLLRGVLKVYARGECQQSDLALRRVELSGDTVEKCLVVIAHAEGSVK